MEKSSIWPVVVSFLAVILLIGNSFALYNLANQNDVVVPTADEIAAKVKVPVAYNDTALQNKVDKIGNEVLSEDLKEAKAEELVSDELASRDFKRELVDVLNDALSDSNSTSEIEDYKDIVSIVVKDKDVVVSGDSASVELELKVGYFLDGDTDSEDKEYARVTVEFSVSELDEDEAYEDAEVDDYTSSDFTFEKFYNY